MSVLQSYDALLSAVPDYGDWPIPYSCNVGTTTAANSTSGLISAQRYPRTVTVPSLGSGVTGVAFPTVDLDIGIGAGSGFSAIMSCGLETLLGTLTVSGNSFAAGSAMPTKTVKGTSVATATDSVFAVATTALGGATTPVLTITYTNQSGTGSRTATLTLPSNPAVNTAFLVSPHLQSGDTGIRSVENISISTGTSGTIKIYGVLPLGKKCNGANSAYFAGPDPFTVPQIPWVAVGSETIGFYTVGQTAANDMYAHVVGVADS